MRFISLCVVLSTVLLSACGEPKSSDDPSDGNPASSSSGDKFVLDAKNTTIEFVGTHVGEKPDPRKGEFTELSGSVGIDSDAGTVKSISVKINTSSISTEFEKLTNHLKSPEPFSLGVLVRIRGLRGDVGRPTGAIVAATSRTTSSSSLVGDDDIRGRRTRTCREFAICSDRVGRGQPDIRPNVGRVSPKKRELGDRLCLVFLGHGRRIVVDWSGELLQ